MKKLIMMLLGVAFATFAWAGNIGYITAYSADTSPVDANASWYSCYFMNLDAIKSATGNQLTTFDCAAYKDWLLANFPKNKAATIDNASLIMNKSSAVYISDFNQYEVEYDAPSFSPQSFLAVCFFDHETDHAFKVLVGHRCSSFNFVDDDVYYSITGWIAAPAGPTLDPIEYLTWDASKKSLVAATNTTYEVVTADTAVFEDKTWYVVTNTIERAEIKVNGEAHLILCDGASLKVSGGDNEAGIEVPADKSLTIYGQASGTGKLVANGRLGGAGIGGASENTCGTITINGGTIEAKGGAYGAGIGGGKYCKSAAMITINGGAITANGGIYGAGIGGCSYDGFDATRSGTDVITINGGIIKATGGSNGAAGIGSGRNGLAATVAINGGTITASIKSGVAEAIGSGQWATSAATVTFGTAMASKYVWAGKSATTGEMITTAAFASDHSATYAEVPIETYTVAYDANGATGTMSNSVFAVAKEVTLKKNAFTTPLGYTYAGWATNSIGGVVYNDEATGTDFATTNATLTLYAKWNMSTNGVTATDFTSLTNLIAQAATQGATLPVTIGFTSGVVIPSGETVTLPSGTGFAGLAFVADEGESGLWLEDGVLYGDPVRGEVTVDALELMKLANGNAVPTAFKAITEGETTVTNDVVMLLGDDGVAYDTIADVLAADPRPTTVKLFEVTGYFVSYDANGAVGTMETDMFIPTVPTNLTANAFSAVGNAFAGWTTNGTDVAFADGAAGVDFTTPGETLELTALWTKVETNPSTFAEMTNLFAQATLPVTFTLTNDVALVDGDKIVLPEGKDITFAGEGQFDVSAIVPQFGTPVVVGEGFADDSALALFDTKGVSKLVFDEGTISIVARGETEDFPWILDAEKNVTAWVDPSFTNLASVVVANGPAADAAIDLTVLTNNLEVYGYKPEVTPLNALVKVVEAGETSYLIPTGWIGAKGTYATLEEALAAGETAVTPNFATEEIPAVIAENATAADGIVYTAVVANNPGEVTNAIQVVAAEGLLALATNELANVRLVVAAEAAADVAAEEAKIVAAITNDIPAIADLALDYVDLAVYFDDVPQTVLTEAIGICIPWTLNPQRDYAVARVHGGAAEKLPVGAENAVDGEYVEFVTDGLVIYTKKFSLYAIGEITPFTTVTIPMGIEGFSYVVTNLTTGVKMTFDSTVEGGVTYKLPVGSKVSITCVPEEGYVIDGETTYVIESVTKETTLVDVTLPTAREDDLLYPTGDGDTFVAAAKSTETFNGVLFGEDGVEGVITLKMTKPNKRTNLFNVQATVKTLVDKASYSFQAKKVVVPEAGVLTVELVGKSKASLEHKLVVVLDGDSLTGAFDDWAIDGARDVFGIKNHPKRTALEPLVGTWTGILADEGEQTIGATFSVKIAKTASANVRVTTVDGKSMSYSAKVEIGADGRGVVPVTVSRLSGGVRTSIGFRILFRQTAEGIVAKAVNVTPVRRWSKKAGVTSVSTLVFAAAEKLTVTSKQFRADYVLKLAPTYAEVLGDPASESLRLDTYGRITGSIKWKVPYLDAHGPVRVKSVSGKVTGIMVGEVGIGTVAVKLPTGEKVAIDLELQKE